MESTFPGIQVYLSCRDEHMYLLKDQEKTISRTDLKDAKNKFAYIRELYCDLTKHPVESFMNESDIQIKTLCSLKVEKPSSCVLITNCTPPVKNLSHKQIKQVLETMRTRNLIPAINKPIDEFDLVIGVESEELYEAAALGKQTILIPTGFGENLFKSMFPWAEIMKLDY